jgi:hypothetical protein
MYGFPGSLTIGSGSSDPAVDSRRREDNPSASAVFTPFPASSRTIQPTLSASPLPPRERRQPDPKTPFSPTQMPLSTHNSPTRSLTPETRSLRASVRKTAKGLLWAPAGTSKPSLRHARKKGIAGLIWQSVAVHGRKNRSFSEQKYTLRDSSALLPTEGNQRPAAPLKTAVPSARSPAPREQT